MLIICKCGSLDSFRRFYAVRSGNYAFRNCAILDRASAGKKNSGKKEAEKKEIAIYQQQQHIRINAEETRKLVELVLTHEKCHQANVNIVCIGDARMKQMNGKFLNHHYTTDVLSFLLSDEHEQPLEGEVYVNVAQAKRQAREYGVRTINEIGRLVVHGVLHLLGYEDDTAKKKQEMHKCEDYFLGNPEMEYFNA